MPRGNQTGPMGMGAMTGRAAGYCAGYGMLGYMNAVPGQGPGMGFAGHRGFGGRGWRRWFCAASRLNPMGFGGFGAPYGYPSPLQKPDPQMEKQALRNQAEALQAELDFIKKRLAEMESAAAAP
jgi:hypothetical protein